MRHVVFVEICTSLIYIYIYVCVCIYTYTHTYISIYKHCVVLLRYSARLDTNPAVELSCRRNCFQSEQ